MFGPFSAKTWRPPCALLRKGWGVLRPNTTPLFYLGSTGLAEGPFCLKKVGQKLLKEALYPLYHQKMDDLVQSPSVTCIGFLHVLNFATGRWMFLLCGFGATH